MKLETNEEKEKLLEDEYTIAYFYFLHISNRTDTIYETYTGSVDKYTLEVWETVFQNFKLNTLRKEGKIKKTKMEWNGISSKKIIDIKTKMTIGRTDFGEYEGEISIEQNCPHG